MIRLVIVTIGFLGITHMVDAAENWPQFRGESASGIATGKNLPVRWSTDKNVAWQTTIPGEGWSCPIVWKNRVFVTSFVSGDKVVAPRKGFYAPRKTKKPAGDCRWLVYCLDAETGKIVWKKAAHKGQPQHSIHVKGSYAPETPVTDGERVYAYFGNVGLFCFDMDGKELWSKKWKVYDTVLGWGTGASPTLYEDRIYILNDNVEHSFLTALDKRTGREIWKVKRNERGSWATPYIWHNKLRTEIITCAPGKARSYDLNGKLLWEIRHMSSICVPTPVTAHDLLYINSGYEYGLNRPVYAVRPGAMGDITLKQGETSNKFIAWYNPRAGSYHPSTLAYGDYVYVLYSRGFLGCFDAKTGKEVYKKQRLEGFFTASPWAYDGKIFCLNESGETYVIPAGPKFKMLARNSLDEMCLATPAVAGDRLFIRTLTKLYCIRRSRD